jgi:hypothetical protein
MTAQQEPTMDGHQGVRELIVAADQDALNVALEQNQIRPEKIISVIWQDGQSLAIGDHGPKYRVIYRA